jgi:hypothetical protein
MVWPITGAKSYVGETGKSMNTVELGYPEGLLAKKCAVKGAGLQRVQFPPGNLFAPPGSNRSGSGGNEAVGAFDGKGRLATPRACRP